MKLQPLVLALGLGLGVASVAQAAVDVGDVSADSRWQ